MKTSVLVTGAAGFIGFHLCKRLSREDISVVGLDNLNDYYDKNLKMDRVAQIRNDHFEFEALDLCDKDNLESLFESKKFDYVVNLAAQAGVRYSLTNPQAYIDSNIQGFMNILECCRHSNARHLIYASSSSVYGANETMPFSVHDNVDHPISLYAATKKSNELMAHTYSSLYNLATTGLRFFTVYGPWGRPDMALFLFTKAILEGQEIEVFNLGNMSRDFTYVDDIVEGIARLIPKPPKGNENWSGKNPDPASSFSPYQLFNIGNNNPVKLLDFINEIELALGIEAKKRMLPIQPGDVESTFADVQALDDYIGFKPRTSIKFGVKKFVEWYKTYYRVTN